MRKLSIFLSVFVVCMCMGLSSFAEQNDTYIYTVSDSGGVSIQGYLNEISGDLVIPSEIDGHPVTAIERYVFMNCDITSVFIPASVSYIGPGAFSGCTSLTSIEVEEGNETFSVSDGILYSSSGKTLSVYPASRTDTSYTVPEGVDTIGAGAFSGNQYIEQISMPNTVAVIDSRAFYDCPNLRSVDLDDIIYIGDSAFYNCQNLEAAEFSSSLTTIDSYAFENCVSLTDIDLPDSLIEVSEAAFRSCTSLSSVSFGAQTQRIGFQAFYGCTSLQSVDLPDTVTSIVDSAFAYCTSLSQVNVGSGLESIGSTAFQGCTMLESAVFSGEQSPQDVGEKVFEEAENVTISFPNSPEAEAEFEDKLSASDAPSTSEVQDVIDYNEAISSGLSQRAKTLIVVGVCAAIVIAAIVIVCVANREKKDDFDGYRNTIDQSVLEPSDETSSAQSVPEPSAETSSVAARSAAAEDAEQIDSVSLPDTPEEFRVEDSSAEAEEKITEIREYIDSVEIHGQLRKRRRNPDPVRESEDGAQAPEIARDPAEPPRPRRREVRQEDEEQ